MKKYIIFIIILIIILLLINNFKLNNNESKEELTLTSDQKRKVNNKFKYFLINDESINIPLANITGNLNVGNKNFNFERLIVDFKYPVGCYYVQYPDKNGLTRISQNDIYSEIFPEEKSPGHLFGGEWVNVWNRESIYFRTGDMSTLAYDDSNQEDNLPSDSRENGLQNYAMPKLSGWTGWLQGDESRLGSGNFETTGVFTRGETYFDNVPNSDDDANTHIGIVNIFDTNNVYPNNNSDSEIRVKNRLMKVWKRVK